MDDPVLHRKMFRHKALRTGVLKPKKYNIGAPDFGVSTEVASRNPAYVQPSKTFIKGNIKYTVGPMGNIIASERIPVPQIEYKPGLSTRFGNNFFNVAERLFDPEGYKKNYRDVKRVGAALVNPETYKKAGKGIGKGIKGFGKMSAGYLGASAVGEMTGTSKVVEPALATTGIAQLAEGLGAGRIPLGIGKAIRFAAGPGRLLTSPYGLAAAAIAAPVYGMYKLDQYLMKPKEVIDPKTGKKTLVESNYAKQTKFMQDEANRELFDPMSPDDAMLSFDMMQRAEAKAKKEANAMPGSDLQVKGEIPSGKTNQGQGTGDGTGGTGTPPPEGGKVLPATTTGDNKIGKTEVPTNVNQDLNKKTEELNKKKTSNPSEQNKKDMFERLQAFSQTTAGNMFMLKLAAGLISGKGSFGEVVGNALNPAVDTLAAYKLKEQELDNELLVAKYKALKDRIGTPEPGTLPVQNEDGSMSYLPAFRDNKTGQVTYVQNGQELVAGKELSSLYTKKKLEVGTKQIDIIGKLGDNSGASAIIQDLLLQNPQNLGTSGAVKLFGVRVAGVVGAVKDIGKKVSYKDIIDTTTGKVVEGAKAKDAERLSKEIDKNLDAWYGQFDDKTKAVLAANGVRKETLKYFLANAFKSEDRLTNRDLEFIGKITNVLAFSKDGKFIQSELREIQGYLDTKRKTFVRQLHASGYSDLDIATNIFGTNGGVIAGSIYGTKNIPDYGKMLPGQINKQLEKQGIK